MTNCSNESMEHLQKTGKSITKNSIYYSFYQGLNVVFPFLTGMYVARVLLPESVGKVAYAQNIAQYFVILSFLGIPTYGMREIAKTRNDFAERSKVYSELFAINFISTTIFSLLYVLLVFSNSRFHSELKLYLVTGLAIIFNYIDNSWLYDGLEEFKFISVRNIIFKISSFVALVMFVNSPKDYITYALITVLGTAGNNIVNIIYCPKFVHFSLRELNLKRHMRSILLLVVVNIAIELYTLVDVTMLGMMTSNKNVAYYSYASKINRIFVQLINAITIVVVPRLAFYYKEARRNDFNDLLTKAFEIILVIGIPIVVGIQICAPDAISLIYGKSFLPSANVLRILSIVLVVSPIGYLLGSRVLLVTDNEKTMTLCVGVGALVNVIGNAILIPIYFEYGAALASVFSEFAVMLVYVHYGKKLFSLNNNLLNIVKILISSLTIVIFCIAMKMIIPNRNNAWLFARLVVQVIGSSSLYFGILFLLNEPMVKRYVTKIIYILKRN